MIPIASAGLQHSTDRRVPDRHAPPLHPDKPTVRRRFIPACRFPGGRCGAGSCCTSKIAHDPYADIEVRVRRQLVRLFGAYGFKPTATLPASSSIGGATRALSSRRASSLRSRWEAQSPRASAPGYGRVSIGHSELNGTSTGDSAVEYGRKAGERAATMLYKRPRRGWRRLLAHVLRIHRGILRVRHKTRVRTILDTDRNDLNHALFSRERARI